jgi:hypothetical protein
MDSSVAGPQTHFRENNPMHSRHAVERITFFPAKSPPRHPEVRVARCAASRREPRRMDGPHVAASTDIPCGNSRAVALRGPLKKRPPQGDGL